MNVRFAVLIVLLAGSVFPTPAFSQEAADSTPVFRLIGNGALGLQEGREVQSGAFGVDYRTRTATTTGVWTIEGSAQAVEGRDADAFAASLLPIRNGTTGLFVLYRKSHVWKGFGFQGYASSGNLTWRVIQASGDSLTEKGSVVALGGSVLRSILPATLNLSDNHVRALLGLGYTGRIIYGDIAKDSFMLEAMGSTQDTFHGIEAIGVLEINDAEVMLTLPIIFGGEEETSSFAGGQWVVTLSLKAGLRINT